MKLALGTVQFGLDYGISNSNGRVDEQQVAEIFTFAQDNGIETIDTAVAYGESEEVIGRYVRKTQSEFKIITKLMPTLADGDSFESQITSSLSKLKRSMIYAVLLHDANILLGKNANKIYDELYALKQKGYCQKIGLSVYCPEQLNSILNNFEIDIVQIPLNIFDQRFCNKKLVNRLLENKIEIHARSLFLQGLLLMNSNQRPSYFNDYITNFSKLERYCKLKGLSKLQAYIAFSKSVDFVDKFICGTTSLLDLQQIVSAYKQATPLSFDLFSSTESKLINPSLWPCGG